MARQFRRIDAKVPFLKIFLIFAVVWILAVGISLFPFNAEWYQRLPLAADLATALITFMAILFAVYVYYKENRRHSAGMLWHAFSDFYNSDAKRVVRAALEKDNENSVPRKNLKCAVDKSVKNVSLDAEEEKLAHDLDDYLNFFQFIGWLLQKKDLTQDDVTGMFSYYVNDLCGDHNDWLLPYIHKYKFDGLEKLLREARSWPSDNQNLLFVYGTLQKKVAAATEKKLMEDCKYKGKACLWGKLYDVGEYPALIESWNKTDIVKGELYSVSNEKLEEIKEHEGPEYTPTRCKVNVGKDKKTAHVFIYNQAVTGMPLISSGDYVDYCTNKKKNTRL